MKKLLFCFGTRPEAIKMAPLINFCERQGVPYEVCLTGQHRDMVQPFMEFFKLTANYNLDVMKPGQSLSGITSSILMKMDRVLEESRPDVVVVQGDTTTTFTCGLAAFYKQIPVAHVEAGLRTGRLYSPFPEEVNRKLVTSFASYFFAPTEEARKNLEKEGISKNVWVTGNTSIDALELTLKKIKENSFDKKLKQKFSAINFEKPYVLVTTHRRENFGEPLHEICKAIKKIANDYQIQIVFPVHLNPKVQEVVREHLANDKLIHLIDPLEYRDFVWMMSESYLILSDSGGVQEEAPHFKVPILVLRKDTERPEGLNVGVAKLVGNDSFTIVEEVRKLLEDSSYYKSFSKNSNPYGDGSASEKIISNLMSS